jgi:hypothetical protein
VQEGRGMAEPSDPHRGSWGAGCTPESRRCGGKTRLKQEERIVGELPNVEWCGTWKVVSLCCQNDVFHLTNFENYKKINWK